ncbi:diaminopimelate decarboxylase [Candidatus Vidania fulgoroideorum]
MLKKIFIKAILNKIIKRYDHPTNIYIEKLLLKNLLLYQRTSARVFYALKANYNVHIINIISSYVYGFECVSLNEMRMITQSPIILSGIAKKNIEIEYAIKHHIYAINVESLSELQRICLLANKLSTNVNVFLRINFKINCHTNKFIATGDKDSKFGIFVNEIHLFTKLIKNNKHVTLRGIGFHLGSQIMHYHHYLCAYQKLINLARSLKIKELDLGGGIGIQYHRTHQINKYRIVRRIRRLIKDNNTITFIIEPGRSIMADCCFTIFRIEYIKRHFAITDLGMNNIIRPMLYHSFHKIISTNNRTTPKDYDIVGPICECGDYLAKRLSLSIKEQDILIIFNTGAYCTSMQSNYNQQPRALEVLLTTSNALIKIN